MGPTDLIAGPYTPPRPERGRVYDAMRHRWGRVGGYHPTTFGPWPAYGGHKQTRPIVCDELRRAVETEAASAVAHHWRVAISTVVRWRANLLADPRTEVPGTVRLHSAVASAPTPAKSSHCRRITAAYTPADDAVIASHPPAEAAILLGRTERAVRVRRSRLGLAGPIGRPPKPTGI